MLGFYSGVVVVTCWLPPSSQEHALLREVSELVISKPTPLKYARMIGDSILSDHFRAERSFTVIDIRFITVVWPR